VLALVVTLTACVDGASDEVLEAGAVKILVAAPADSGMDAMVIGTVAIVDGCLGIGDHVAVWPSGTDVVAEDPLVIDVPGLGEVRVGDDVTGAGGYVQEYGRGDGPALPDECSDAFVVIYRPE
jgi:hypothetical protein